MCVCAHALVCLLVFAVLNNKDCVCVCVARLLRVALSGENEGVACCLEQPSVVLEKGAPAPFDVSPSLFMCCQSAGSHWPFDSSDGF